MRLTSRGFTLVELMIVIAIIGILAAALFPSMTAYLKRSRDAARVSGTKDITSAVGAFFSDKERYPDHWGSCVNSGAFAASAPNGLTQNYLPKGLPTDPTALRNNGCGLNANYGYGSGVNAANGAPQFFVTALMENEAGGNITWPNMAAYLGAGRTANPPALTKGAGSGYLLTN